MSHDIGDSCDVRCVICGVIYCMGVRNVVNVGSGDDRTSLITCPLCGSINERRLR